MFVHTLHSSRLKAAVPCAAVLLLGAAFLSFPAAMQNGVSRGLTICGSILIPGLFPFLVLADLAVKSGACSFLGRLLRKPIAHLFHLPGCCGTAIFIGLVGGYPAGAITTAELYRSGAVTQEEARRLLRFCVNAGPAFIISTVGVGLLGNVRIGLLLYIAHVISALLIGIADGLRERFLGGTNTQAVVISQPIARLPLGTALPQSVNNACRSLLSMCGFVLLSSATLSLLDAIGLTQYPPLDLLLPSLLEVSCGCLAVASSPAMPLLLGTILGFGGLSVHGQLAAALADTPLIRGDFFAARLLQALLSGAITAFLFRLWPQSNAVFLPLSETLTPSLSGNAAAGAALLVMCGLFLLATRRETTI